MRLSTLVHSLKGLESVEHSCHPGACPQLPLPRGCPSLPHLQQVCLSLQVALDLSQHQGIAVRRVLNTEGDVVSKFGVTDFPSCYLLFRNGSTSRVHV